jgi:predicted glycoside hydrolase/deacetylase ChbG (UPF0249 family)
MHSSRRTFVQSLGLGAGVLGLAAATTRAADQTASATPAATAKMGGRKMVVRADDIGHSRVCNIGTFEAIQNGVVTSADVMLDSPGTEDALERLRAYPWISIGWHMHMWGAPTLPVSEVPSLIEKGGQFDGRFRMDLAQSGEVVFDQAVRELRAQLNKCLRILGRVPDTGNGGNDRTPWGRAIRQVADEFGLAYNFSGSAPTLEKYQQKVNAAQKAGDEWAKYYSATPSPGGKADERWASRNIFTPAGTNAYIDLLTDSISSVEKNYDPVLFYTEDRSGILKYPEDWTFVQAWHPGYVDYYVYRLGERVNRARAQQFVVGRTQDVAALCDPRLRNWIKANRIELVNQRDALYGTASSRIICAPVAAIWRLVNHCHQGKP